MMPTRYLYLTAVLFVTLEAFLIGFVDRPLSEYLRTVDQNHHALIDFFRSYTDLAKSKVYLLVSSIGILLCALALRIKSVTTTCVRVKDAGEKFFFFFACIAVSGLATDIIKMLIGRARPVELQSLGLYGIHPLSLAASWHSFPSGHATTAFALATSLAILFPRARYGFIICAIALAASRVMVNAHFLSDILAGAVVGVLTTLALKKLFNLNGIIHLVGCIFPIDKHADKI